MRGLKTPTISILLITSASTPTHANEPPPEISTLLIGTNTAWITIATLGIALASIGHILLRSGLSRLKNAAHPFFEQPIVIAAAILGYWTLGWGVMFGDGTPWSGTSGLWFLQGTDNSPALLNERSGNANYSPANPFNPTPYEGVYDAAATIPVPLQIKFTFHALLAALSAQIIFAPLAERLRYQAAALFAFLYTAILYPTVGHWIWGDGLLMLDPPEAGFTSFWGNYRDAAGASLLHLLPSLAALSALLIIGPRIGHFTDRGTYHLPQHNLTQFATGTLLLLIGIPAIGLGKATHILAPHTIAQAALNSLLSITAATLTASLASTFWIGKPSLRHTLLGSLGGAIAISAPLTYVATHAAFFIGLISGLATILSIWFWQRLKIDDPTHTLSTHGTNALLSILLTGLFFQSDIAKKTIAADTGLPPTLQFLQQLKGLLLITLFALPFATILWLILKATIALRVPIETEHQGLDQAEIAEDPYPEFTRTSRN
jgi:Amt family ammonium transporter